MSRLTILPATGMSKLNEPSHKLTDSKGDFPHNSRFFPASLLRMLPKLAQKIFMWTALAAIVFIYTTTQKQAQSTSVLGSADDQSKQATEQRNYEILQKQYAYWQTVISSHPDYRDGYYALAVLAYKLGRDADVGMYIGQVQKIDPNFVENERLQSVLKK